MPGGPWAHGVLCPGPGPRRDRPSPAPAEGGRGHPLAVRAGGSGGGGDRGRRADRSRVAADLLSAASAPGTGGLAALGAITDAVEAGAGLPEVLRAASRALNTSLILIDRGGSVLAVAARSPADERSLMRGGEDVTAIELKVADRPVGTLRMRARQPEADAPLLRLVSTLIASEMERTRAPLCRGGRRISAGRPARRDRRPREPGRPRARAGYRPGAGGQRDRGPGPSAQSHRG